MLCAALLIAATAFGNPPRLDGVWSRDADGAATERQRVEVETPNRALRIAILPDRTTGRDWGLPYFAAAVEDLKRLRPDAVFTVGDMVQGYTRSTETWNAEAAEWFAIADRLPWPIWPVAGNHDVVSGTRDPKDNTFEERYRRTFGPLRYAVELPDATVIVVYSDGRRAEEGVALSPEDLDWLEESLTAAESRDKPILLLMHRPMWRSRSARWDELVHPMLVEHGVSAVIAGHFHALQRDPDRDGVQYHILAACGGMIDQHPHTGQLQHLTFVDVLPEGAVEVHHQLLGVTLPPDHVTAEDQERAWRLKQTAEAVSFRDAIVEPLTTPTRGSLEIELFNPLDIPIRWNWSGLDAPPSAEVVPPAFPGAISWNSRTPVDTFNPFTMLVDSPLAIEPGGPVELAPLERKRIRLGWRIESAVATPLPATEVRFRAIYRDGLDREVPVTVIKRVPIARTAAIAAVGESSTESWTRSRFPISAWEFSPYDSLEADASARFGLDRDGSLLLDVEAPDEVVSTSIEDPRLDPSRLDDPMLDSIRIDLSRGESDRSWLLEFPAEGEPRGFLLEQDLVSACGLDGVSGPLVSWTREEGRWRATVRIAPRLWPAGESDGLRLQLGVADNDETYHTQWRFLAPEGYPLRLLLPPMAEPNR